MRKDIYELVNVTPHQVAIKVKEIDNLTRALHSYAPSADIDYITVTRGANNTMRFIKKDGKTFSISFGDNGHTLISDSLESTKKSVIAFLEDNGIILGFDGTRVDVATIYYNSNFKKWQLTIEQRSPRYCKGYYFSNDSQSLEEMQLEASRFIDAKSWRHEIAVTGIDVWKGVLA